MLQHTKFSTMISAFSSVILLSFCMSSFAYQAPLVHQCVLKPSGDHWRCQVKGVALRKNSTIDMNYYATYASNQNRLVPNLSCVLVSAGASFKNIMLGNNADYEVVPSSARTLLRLKAKQKYHAGGTSFLVGFSYHKDLFPGRVTMLCYNNA